MTNATKHLASAHRVAHALHVPTPLLLKVADAVPPAIVIDGQRYWDERGCQLIAKRIKEVAK